MPDLPKGKPILCIDFDGVLHSYRSGWQGARNIPDQPVQGSMAFLVKAMQDFQVHIFSSRSRYWGGRRAMKRWLIEYMELYYCAIKPEWGKMTCHDDDFESVAQRVAKETIEMLNFPLIKPAAFMMIDDRAFCFRGRFPSIEEIKEFKPWYK